MNINAKKYLYIALLKFYTSEIKSVEFDDKEKYVIISKKNRTKTKIKIPTIIYDEIKNNFIENNYNIKKVHAYYVNKSNYTHISLESLITQIFKHGKMLKCKDREYRHMMSILTSLNNSIPIIDFNELENIEIIDNPLIDSINIEDYNTIKDILDKNELKIHSFSSDNKLSIANIDYMIKNYYDLDNEWDDSLGFVYLNKSDNENIDIKERLDTLYNFYIEITDIIKFMIKDDFNNIPVNIDDKIYIGYDNDVLDLPKIYDSLTMLNRNEILTFKDLFDNIQEIIRFFEYELFKDTISLQTILDVLYIKRDINIELMTIHPAMNMRYINDLIYMDLNTIHNSVKF